MGSFGTNGGGGIAAPAPLHAACQGGPGPFPRLPGQGLSGAGLGEGQCVDRHEPQQRCSASWSSGLAWGRGAGRRGSLAHMGKGATWRGQRDPHRGPLTRRQVRQRFRAPGRRAEKGQSRPRARGGKGGGACGYGGPSLLAPNSFLQHVLEGPQYWRR